MRAASFMALLTLTLVGLLGSVIVAASQPTISTATAKTEGPTAGEILITEFYMAVGDHYDVPYSDVLDVLETGLSNEEMPVALHIAKRSKTAAVQVAQERLQGQSWQHIYESHGLTSRDFYIKLKTSGKSKLFRRIMGNKRLANIADWDLSLSLNDTEVINLVNLSVVLANHPDQEMDILNQRILGRKFVVINRRSAVESAKSSTMEMASGE